MALTHRGGIHEKSGASAQKPLKFCSVFKLFENPYCNRNRHTHIGNNLVCTGTTLFLKIGSMCLSAAFRRKIKLGTTNGFFLRRYLLDLAHALSTNEVPLTWGALRDLLTDLKTKARDNINAGFFCPPFFYNPVYFQFYSSLSIDIYNFFKYDHGFF